MTVALYPTYRNSEVPWLGTIPSTWAVKPLWAITTCNDDVLCETMPANYRIRYIEISDVDNVQGILGATEINFGEAPSRARRQVRDGDVIVSTVRTYLRAIAPIRGSDANTVVSTGFAVMRPKLVKSDFLAYLFCAEFLISEIIAKSVGVSYPAINPGEIGQIRVPVPSHAEQSAIVTFLDRETGKIDVLVAEQERLITLLKEKRQAVISQAVTKGLDLHVAMKSSGIEWLGEMPQTWETKRIASLFREVAEEGQADLPVLSVSIHDGVSDRELLDEEMDRKVTRSDNRSKYKTVQPGDLVYNMMRAWQGGFGTVAVHGMVSPAYVVARPRGDLSAEFVELLLRTPPAIEQMRRYSKGVTDFRLRLYWDEFKQLQVPVPPAHVQTSILDFVGQKTAQGDALAAEAERTITLFKERRAALISAAVTGKIDVRNFVEPAAQPAIAA